MNIRLYNLDYKVWLGITYKIYSFEKKESPGKLLPTSLNMKTTTPDIARYTKQNIIDSILSSICCTYNI